MPPEITFEQPTDRSIWLWSDGAAEAKTSDGFRPWLDPYLADTDQPRGAVVIFPGGGYGCRVRHEGVVIAEMFNAAGIHAFVAHYRVTPNYHPGPLNDACRAIRMVRDRAGEWNVLADRVAVCGFSAGGHLAGHVSTAPHAADPAAADPLARLDARPNASILCYAVLSSSNRQCYLHLLGDDATDEQIDSVTPDRLVDVSTPPAFLWHTAADATVPVAASLRYATALDAAGVPFETHVYPDGVHGLGLSPNDPHVATWTDLCCVWLRGMGWGG